MPTLYIDCSSTYKSLINTGIQRVVRNLARHAPANAVRRGYTVRLVAIKDGEFAEVFLDQFQVPQIGSIWQRRTGQYLRINILTLVTRLRHHLEALSTAPAWKDFINAPYYRYGLARGLLYPTLLARALVRRLTPGAHASQPPAPLWSATDDLSDDILLLADSGWDRADSWGIARQFRQQGGYVATVIHDLIPLSHPQFYEPYLVNVFTHWINESIACVDFYIGVSRSTETALRAFLVEANASNPTGYFHLGSDLDLKAASGRLSRGVRGILAGGEPLFLVVGSLEPRKNLAFILDAFERAWEKNPDIRLVIVGHNTWKVAELLERIQQHPWIDRKLFWLRDASDTDLEYLYAKATALVFASIIEGFGLPIVEAMQRGLPVLCSDIPVFREIADGKAIFFALETTDQLVDAICQSAAACGGGQVAARRVYPWLSWRESTGMLLDRIDSKFQFNRKGNATCA
jgi:glycosyltransferase involved in cell wall biosynthesis